MAKYENLPPRIQQILALIEDGDPTEIYIHEMQINVSLRKQAKKGVLLYISNEAEAREARNRPIDPR